MFVSLRRGQKKMPVPLVCYYISDRLAEEKRGWAVEKESPDKEFDNYYISRSNDVELIYYSPKTETTSAIIELDCNFKPGVLLVLLTNDKTSPHFRREYTHVFILARRPFHEYFTECDSVMRKRLAACINKQESFEYTFLRTPIPIEAM